MVAVRQAATTYHVPHGIPLETELLRQVEEDVFNFLLGEWDLTLYAPSRIRLSDTGGGKRVDEGGGGRLGNAHARGAERLGRRSELGAAINVGLGVGIRMC